MDIPEWIDVQIPPEELISGPEIADPEQGYAMSRAAIRSYCSRRRDHPLYGRMPRPVCRISGRPLWLKRDVELWLTCPIPEGLRSTQRVNAWIRAGRPRT